MQVQIFDVEFFNYGVYFTLLAYAVGVGLGWLVRVINRS